MTEPNVTGRDIIIRTTGLAEDELAAVISVVRATVEEELTARDLGEEQSDRSTQRWRRSSDSGLGTGIGWGLGGLCGDREWR